MIQQKQVEPDRKLFRKLYTPFKLMPQAHPDLSISNIYLTIDHVFQQFQYIIVDELQKLNDKLAQLEEQVKGFSFSTPSKNREKLKERTTGTKSKIHNSNDYERECDFLRRQMQELKQMLQSNHHHKYPSYHDEEDHDVIVSPFTTSPSKNIQSSIIKQHEKQQQILQAKINKYRTGLLDFLLDLKQFKKELENALPCEGCELKGIVNEFLTQTEQKDINLLIN